MRMSLLFVVAASVSLPLGVLPSTAAGGTSVTVERMEGSDRYETSVEVARQVGGGSLTGLDRLIVATGERFPDGLTASGLAGFLDQGGRSGRTAILLTRSASLPKVVADAIRNSGVPASEVFVVGGTSAVSAEVFTAVAEAAGWDGTGENPVTRIAGEDRFETAAAIVEFVKQKSGGSLPDSYRTVLVASGETFPDAMAGGTLAYRSGHLIVLSPPPSMPQVALSAVDTLAANCAVVLGGTDALASRVSEQVEDRLVPGGCGEARVGGADRFETASMIATRFRNVNGPATEVTLVSGVDFADALTSAPLAGGNRPVLLATSDGLPTPTESWLRAQAGVTTLFVVGGAGAIGSSVVGDALGAIPIAPAPDPSSTGGGGTTLSLSYPASVFSMLQTSHSITPSVTGAAGTVSYSLSGTLPNGVTFDQSTGAFTGPSAWNFEAVQISAGNFHTCALLIDSTARCWGDNWGGKLGDGTTTASPTPVTVSVAPGGAALSGITQISAGGDHTCAVLTDGTARCWGLNGSGRLGDGSTTSRSNPVSVSAAGGALLSGITQISSGFSHTCAVLTDGTAHCWGNNQFGRLGDGTTTASHTPVTVSVSVGGAALTGVTHITARDFHTCAVLIDGTARCWGANWDGQLGDGTTTDSSSPVSVSVAGGAALSDITQIAAGTSHTCVVLTDGTARCWGLNGFGQLGDGTTTDSSTPVSVSATGGAALSGITQISAGGNHSCAVLNDETAHCWGDNDSGQVGSGAVETFDGCMWNGEYRSWLGTETQCDGFGGSWEPITKNVSPIDAVAVLGLSGVLQITTRDFHTCAVIVDGSARCWGANNDGRLGDGTTTSRATPVGVTDIDGNFGWPASVTVTATDGVSSVTATITLTKN